MALSERNYELLHRFNYHFKGEVTESNFVTMKAPTSKHISLIAPIKQAFIQSIQEYQKNNRSGEIQDTTESDIDNSEFTGEIAIMMLECSSIDMQKFMLHAMELLKTELFLIDGEQKINNEILQMFDLQDIYNIVGEYSTNFIIASLVK